ncbi:MAG: type III PLP-dependent enzyme [Defluviicoccus sp.]|nr:type III PLP-dependent enzyme [Defluviicoccus sp.]
MVQGRFRAAVSPVRRRFDAPPAVLPTVNEVIAASSPGDPVHCIRPRTITEAASAFVASFPGDVLYAVKCNPDPRVLRVLWGAGVRHFDCASAAEVALVRRMFPAADIHFMHPVKARAAIREAWADQGVRDFSFDSQDELAKILAETGAGRASGGAGAPADLGLLVRLAVANDGALHDLSGKFGAAPAEAAALLAAARPYARRLGVCFHVGSQCLDPAAWAKALAAAAQVVAQAGVPIEVIDVGGGFPAAYVDTAPPPLAAFFAAITGEIARQPHLQGARLWAEPGRALVADGVSVVVQVLHRRGDVLYINDGVYGSLSDAGRPGLLFPARLIAHDDRLPSPAEQAFQFYGPTCDSLDFMPGPFALPADVREGDWIEIGQLGAYGAALRTAFNGFDRAQLVEVRDDAFFAAGSDDQCTRMTTPALQPARAALQPQPHK